MNAKPLWRRRRYRPVLAVTALGALAAPMLWGGPWPDSSPANATAAAPVAHVPPTTGGSDPTPVTLITGDTVMYDEFGDGQVAFDTEQAPREDGATVGFQAEGTEDDFYIYPTDVLPLINAGVLDRELFNVPGLIRQGLSDPDADTLPIIVTYDAGQRSGDQLSQEAAALPALSDPQPLRSMQGAGGSVERTEATDFWNEVTAGQTGDAGPSALANDLRSIHLDQAAEVDLDESVAQIGAPQVWDVGYDGDGATVAILDTGIDGDHPDLAGKVVMEESFTPDPDASDENGHGTHVAGTVAGTGAAGDGTYVGVAPGAELMNAKVCNANGTCLSSNIIAGMEWAAENGADVVNLSLSAAASDGTDPISEALNQLSAEHDTLFVASAGNNGPAPSTVGSPAAADAALAVGAVDKDDQLASFSSRGPRVGAPAVKPEITAPGVDVVAPLAEGTGLGAPIDDHYTSANGTSMAAPHVAGAAALAKQALPELGAAEMKDALVSTADDGGYWVFDQGTGRLDAERAVTQGIVASAVVDFGSVEDEVPQQREITYRNETDDLVTLDLDLSVLDRSGNAAFGASLSDDNVDVPAHGKATVTIDLNPAADQRGVFGGTVSATSPEAQLRTAVGFAQLDEQEVTVEVLDSTGSAADGVGVWLIHDSFNPDEPIGEELYEASTIDGVANLTVPAGTYTASVSLVERDPETGAAVGRANVLTELEQEIDSDTTITLDARDTVPVEQPVVSRDVDVRQNIAAVTRHGPERSFVRTPATPPRGDGEPAPFYVTPTDPGEIAPIVLHDRWVLAEPVPLKELSATPGYYSEAPAYTYHLPFLHANGIPDDFGDRLVSSSDLVEVPTRYHGDHDDTLITVGEIAVPEAPLTRFFQVAELMMEPGETTQYYLAGEEWYWVRQPGLTRLADPALASRLRMVSGDRFFESEAGDRRVEERWFEAPLRVGAVELRDSFVDYHEENIYGTPRSAVMARGGPNGNEFVPATEAMDNSGLHATGSTSGGSSNDVFASWRMWDLSADQELQPDYAYDDERPVFHLSDETVTYKLEQIERYPENWANQFRTKPRGTTTWTFESERSDEQVGDGFTCAWLGGGNTCQVQPLIQLRYDLGLDVTNQAPANQSTPVTIHAGSHTHAVQRAPVTDLSVDTSFDGGDSWQGANVAGQPRDDLSPIGEQSFQVIIDHPALAETDGFVWLRAKAQDADGNTVEQIIERAYMLGEDASPPVTCNEVIDGFHAGPLLVTDGVTCVEDGAQLVGPVQVQPGAGLIVGEASLSGRLSADRASVVELAGGTITGPVTVQGTDESVTVKDMDIRGPVSVTSSNTGETPVVISGNTIHGPLECVGNAPSPVDDGVPNSVTGRASDQCAELTDSD